jgi:gliding motility-associated lipoprotein GldD
MFNLKRDKTIFSRLILVMVFMGLFLFSSCKEDVFPKPSSYLRLDYPIAKYADFENECPFTFEMNSEAVIKGEKDCGFTITYPK